MGRPWFRAQDPKGDPRLQSLFYGSHRDQIGESLIAKQRIEAAIALMLKKRSSDQINTVYVGLVKWLWCVKKKVEVTDGILKLFCIGAKKILRIIRLLNPYGFGKWKALKIHGIFLQNFLWKFGDHTEFCIIVCRLKHRCNKTPLFSSLWAFLSCTFSFSFLSETKDISSHVLN